MLIGRQIPIKVDVFIVEVVRIEKLSGNVKVFNWKATLSSWKLDLGTPDRINLQAVFAWSLRNLEISIESKQNSFWG